MRIQKAELSKKLTVMVGMSDKTGILYHNGILVANNMFFSLIMQTGYDDQDTFLIPDKASTYINSLPVGMVDLDATDKILTIRSECGECSFTTTPADTLPEIPNASEEQPAFRCEGDVFCDALRRTIYACGNHNANQALNGICLDGDGLYMNVVACDGYRLAKSRFRYKGNISMVIPKELANAVLKLGADGIISIYTYGKKAVIRTESYTIVGSLYAGSYFDYNKFLPSAEPQTIVVDAEEFSNSVDRAGNCAGDATKPVKLQTNGRCLELSCKSNTANFNESIAIASGVVEIKIAVNAMYISNAMKTIQSDAVPIDYYRATAPLILHDGEDTLHLIMPVRLLEGE